MRLDLIIFIATSHGETLWGAYQFLCNPILHGSIGSPKVFGFLRKSALKVATLVNIDREEERWKGKWVREFHIGSEFRAPIRAIIIAAAICQL